MPHAFDEGAACHYPARGTHPRWSNDVVAWSQHGGGLELFPHDAEVMGWLFR
ncbi:MULTISPECIES: hypothetical protein [Actinomyces]|uniref:Uncharacterized protein n=1 Tax=Actinomyces glycerinitolerans TaxID=1892869 RepID=A0A1M4RVX8_9ACTO|nr:MULTISPECIES: hypothetical protein [Actinomyces]SHE24138.1 Hypothetical protein ACGLYG10_0338 [Actinomyces glycerinitolerans]